MASIQSGIHYKTEEALIICKAQIGGALKAGWRTAEMAGNSQLAMAWLKAGVSGYRNWRNCFSQPGG
jgi:hypothetical protein